MGEFSALTSLKDNSVDCPLDEGCLCVDMD